MINTMGLPVKMFSTTNFFYTGSWSLKCSLINCLFTSAPSKRHQYILRHQQGRKLKKIGCDCMTVIPLLLHIYSKCCGASPVYMYSKKYTLKRAAWWKVACFSGVHHFSYYLTKISFNQTISSLSYSPWFQNDLWIFEYVTFQVFLTYKILGKMFKSLRK